jgi:hypothetical protein
MAGIATIVFLDIWKSMKFVVLAADLLRAIVLKDSRGGTRTPSVCGKRITRCISAPEGGRGQLILAYV